MDCCQMDPEANQLKTNWVTVSNFFFMVSLKYSIYLNDAGDFQIFFEL